MVQKFSLPGYKAELEFCFEYKKILSLNNTHFTNISEPSQTLTRKNKHLISSTLFNTLYKFLNPYHKSITYNRKWFKNLVLPCTAR